jgi:hypothetical protein
LLTQISMFVHHVVVMMVFGTFHIISSELWTILQTDLEVVKSLQCETIIQKTLFAFLLPARNLSGSYILEDFFHHFLNKELKLTIKIHEISKTGSVFVVMWDWDEVRG